MYLYLSEMTANKRQLVCDFFLHRRSHLLFYVRGNPSELRNYEGYSREDYKLLNEFAI